MAKPVIAHSTNVRLPANVTHDISVVIVSYNTRELTLECVRSVKAHAGGYSVQIIVVDNQSNDGSSDALRAEFPEIVVIDSPHNGGFAYGNAIGFEQANGSFILLLNPDTRIFENTFVAAMAHMRDQPKTGILGARVWLEDGTQQSSMMRFLTIRQFVINWFCSAEFQARHPMLGDTRYASRSPLEAHVVDAVSGCFMFVRREVIEQIGSLDTRIFMYGEDPEWCRRASWQGWNVVYDPSVEILHHGAASTASMSEWRAVEMTRGQILFMRFTRGDLVAWVTTLAMLIRDLLRAPAYGLLVIARGFRPGGGTKAWWARMKFLSGALLSMPKGQSVSLPSPESVRRETGRSGVN